MEELELYLDTVTSQIPWKKAKEVRAELEDHIMTKAELICLSGITMEQSIQQVLAEMGDVEALSDDFYEVHKYAEPVALMKSLGLMFAAFVLFSLQFKSLPELIQFEPIYISGSLKIGSSIGIPVHDGAFLQLYSMIRLAFIKGLYDGKDIVFQFIYLIGSLLLAYGLWELRKCSHALRIAGIVSILHIGFVYIGYLTLWLADFSYAWHVAAANVILFSKILLFALTVLGLYQMGKRYSVHSSPMFFVIGLLLLYILPMRLTRSLDCISVFIVFFLLFLLPYVFFMRQLWKADADEPVCPASVRLRLCQGVSCVLLIVGIMAVLLLLPHIYPAQLHEIQHFNYKEMMLWI